MIGNPDLSFAIKSDKLFSKFTFLCFKVLLLVKREEYKRFILMRDDTNEMGIYASFIFSQAMGYFSQILNGWIEKLIIIVSDV